MLKQLGEISKINLKKKPHLLIPQGAAGSRSEGELNLENLEDKEIIVIKDTEKQDQSKVNSL